MQTTRDSVIQLRLRLGTKELPNANATVQPRRRRLRRRRRRRLGGVVIDILCVTSRPFSFLFCTRRRRRSFTLLKQIAVILRPSLNPLKSSTSSCRLTFKKEKTKRENRACSARIPLFSRREAERGK